MVLGFADYYVLVLDPDDPDSDPSGLLGKPGVSGELCRYLDRLFAEDQNFEGLRGQLREEGGKLEPRDLMYKTFLLYWVQLLVLDALREDLGDAALVESQAPPSQSSTQDGSLRGFVNRGTPRPLAGA